MCGLLAQPKFKDGDLMEGKRPSDLNDLYQLRGAEAARECIKAASTPQTEPALRVELLSGADLEPEPIRWLWEGWLARGKLHMLAGAPGTGKTTLAIALAATLRFARNWPDGSSCAHAGTVLIWSGEDCAKDTLIPRLMACGGDRRRVYFVGDVQGPDGRTTFDPAKHLGALREAIEHIGGIDLLIVDPVVSTVSGDSHKNAEVRRALQPIVEIADSFECAVVGISHFSKGTSGRDPVERVTGSVAFGALPRLVFGSAKQTREDGSTLRLFVRAKSNIGPDGGGFHYSLEQVGVDGFPGVVASRLSWGKPLQGTAQQLLGTADKTEDAEEHTAVDYAADWLLEELKHGPIEVPVLKENAGRAGLSWRAVERAKHLFNVGHVRDGFGKGARYSWKLPCSPPDPMLTTPKEMANMGEHGEHGVEQDSIEEGELS